MKRVISALAAVFVFAALFFGIMIPAGLPAHAQTDELYIYNWADYIDPETINDFEQYYYEQTGKNLNVVYSTFDTNEVMLTQVMNNDERMDLLCPSEYAIERLVRNNMLMELDKTKLHNISNIDQRIYDKVDAVFDDIVINNTQIALSDYFVPYMWGTLGILYNAQIVREEDIEAGYGILWNKADNKKLDKKIFLKDSIRDTYVAAVLYLKEIDALPKGLEDKSVQQLINTVNDTMLEAVENALVEQKPFLKGYEVDYGKNEIVANKAYVGLSWSGDAVLAMEENEDLNYFVPEVGGNVWFDGWVIPKNAPNPEIAHMFIDYFCRPEVAIRNAIYIGYTCGLDREVLRGSAETVAILEEYEYDIDEYFNNEFRYPEIDQEQYGVMKDFGAMHEKAVAMWERVKAKGSKTWILFVIIGGVAVMGGGIAAFIAVKNNKGRRRAKVMVNNADVENNEKTD
ncbi:MAG: ABC transporter substrate-binding protein [Christensenellales bacterium]|jgi:spermidine/putrescine transport system substrate-binding protein|nr:ABC transporter substrate-binding protein [Clostridiales bacterium]